MKMFFAVFLAIMSAYSVVRGINAFEAKLLRDEQSRIAMTGYNKSSFKRIEDRIKRRFDGDADQSVTQLPVEFAGFDEDASELSLRIRAMGRGSDAERGAVMEARSAALGAAWYALRYAPNSKAWLKEKFAKYPELQVDVDELAKSEAK